MQIPHSVGSFPICSHSLDGRSVAILRFCKADCLHSGFLALQLTILTLSAVTDWLPLSILNVTFLMRKVHTSSQNR